MGRGIEQLGLTSPEPIRLDGEKKSRKKEPDYFYDIWTRINDAHEQEGENGHLAAIIEKGLSDQLLDRDDVLSLEETIVLFREIADMPNADSLSQNFSDYMMENFLAEWESVPREGRSTLDGEEVMTEAILAVHRSKFKKTEKRKEVKQEYISDRLFRSFSFLISKHPEAGLEYFQALSHGLDSVDAKLLLERLPIMTSDERLPFMVRASILESIGDFYSSKAGKMHLDRGVEQTLDFSDYKNFDGTLAAIKFLEKLNIQSEYLPGHVRETGSAFIVSDRSVRTETRTGIMSILEKKITENAGSYFLNLYTRKVLAGMQEWNDASEFQKRMKVFEKHNQAPFSIAPGMIAVFDDGELYIGNKDNNSELKAIKFEDISVSASGGIDPIAQKTLLDNYKFLLLPETRSIIKNEIGIDLSGISMPEQANFLSYLCDRSVDQIAELKDFVVKYGRNGIKSFLSLEQGGREMGGVILSIGDKLKDQPGIADKLFAKCAEMVDGTDKYVERLMEIVNEVSENGIDRNAAASAIFRKSNELLKAIGVQLSEDADKKQLVNALISSLESEFKVKEIAIKNLSELLEKIKMIYLKKFFYFGPPGNYNSLSEYKRNLEIHKKNRLLDIQESRWRSGKRTALDLEKHKKEMVDGAQIIYQRGISASDYQNIKKDIEKRKKLLAVFESIDMGNYDSFVKNAEKLDILLKNYIEKYSLDREEVKSYDPKSMIEIIKKAKEDRENEEQEAIKELKNILALMDELNTMLDALIYGEKKNNDSQGIAGKVMGKYQEIINQAKEAAQVRLRLIGGEERKLSEEKIATVVDALMAKAGRFLRDSVDTILGDSGEAEALVRKNLEAMDAKIVLLDQILRQTPREEVAGLDLREIADIEKIQDLPASELMDNEELLGKVADAIEAQFPGGDRELFLKECAKNKELSFTLTMANGELLCCFGKEKRGEGVHYLDWFIANPNSPLKGLGEATVKLEFLKPESRNNIYYAVAKPHVKSFALLLEKLGFVAFSGQTLDGEYKHHYTRCRRTEEELALSLKNIDNQQFEKLMNDIRTRCTVSNVLQKISFIDNNYLAVKVSYHGQGYHDDIRADDNDGWIMKEIDRQKNAGYVLSRFVPASSDKDNQEFYAIFEKSQLGKNSELKLLSAIPALAGAASKDH